MNLVLFQQKKKTFSAQLCACLCILACTNKELIDGDGGVIDVNDLDRYVESAFSSRISVEVSDEKNYTYYSDQL